MIINKLKTEIKHFLSLPTKVKTLFASFVFMGIAYPIIGVFLNAYAYKVNNDIVYLIGYTIGRVCGITAAFIANAQLLKKINIKTLYLISVIFMGLASISMVFSNRSSYLEFIFFGLILGLGEGFHWSNRNYLTQKETNSENRVYFTAMNYVSDTILSIVTTFTVGWLIFGGLSYKYLMIFAFLLLALAGGVVSMSNFDTPKISHHLIGNASPQWITFRWIQVSIGISEGVLFFMASYMIMSKFGTEGILGTLTSLTSVLSAIAIYIYGRKSTKRHQKLTPNIAVIIGLLVSSLMGIFFVKLTMLIYILTTGLIISFMWLGIWPQELDLIDHQVGEEEGKRYAYILDLEIFLNIGRFISLLIFLCLTLLYNTESAMRFTSMILFSIQILILIISNTRSNTPITSDLINNK